jgi:hypothetical protein
MYLIDTMLNANNRMQSDFGELALASAADAKRYASMAKYLPR